MKRVGEFHCSSLDLESSRDPFYILPLNFLTLGVGINCCFNASVLEIMYIFDCERRQEPNVPVKT